MKPVSVRFSCFGPYMAEQFIDFEKLEKNGLFLICGETGSGKTTILDAICYALYGHSSGDLRGDMSVMRCKLAGKDEETKVEFTFDCGGERYRFTRSLKFGRTRLNDYHNCLVYRDGQYVPIFENPKKKNVNEKAEELIGLSYEQFRQVIILPQGQFERLLVSNSEDKEKILVSLFQADRWQKMADELYRRVAEKDNALKQEKLRLEEKLRGYGCASLEALEEKLLHSREALDDLRQRAERGEQDLLRLRQAYEAHLVEQKDFLRRDQLRSHAARQQAREEAFRAEEALLRWADAAAEILPVFDVREKARRELLRGEETLKLRETKLTQAELAEKQAAQALAQLEGKRAEQALRSRMLAQLEGARPIYGALAQLQAREYAAMRQMEEQEKARKSAQNGFERADKQWLAAIEAQNRAIGAYQQLQKAYLRGIGGLLAQSLTEDQPCPVCGSRSHPAPAQPGEDSVTDAQLEQSNDAMNRAGEQVTRTYTGKAKAEKLLQEAHNAALQAAQAHASAAQALDSARQQMLAGIPDGEILEEKIRETGAAIRSFEARMEQCVQKLTAAQGNLLAARQGVRDAREGLEEARNAAQAGEEAWQEALTASGLDSEAHFRRANLTPGEKNRRMQELIRYQENLAQVRQELKTMEELLAGRIFPDVAGEKQALDREEKLHKLTVQQKTLAESACKTMEADEKNLRRRTEDYHRERQQVEENLDFANKLRGRSGISLQRYVLGVMLTSITVEANRLLQHVCAGRYRLYRTDDIAGSGHKGGLELEVQDSQTGGRRSVTTLSGGEKFLVALSLAIGLSTVVQAQGSGIRLEAMFIDEGFGSLDREAVGDALEVLQGIQRSAGVVGIISHVEQLAESIPTRIEITKGRSGSRCRILGMGGDA